MSQTPPASALVVAAVALVAVGSASSIAFVAPASAAGTTVVSLDPADAEVEAGQTVTFGVVVESAARGVGAVDATVTLEDPTVATLTNVTVAGDPPAGTSITRISDGGARAQVRAALMNTTDDGRVTVATVTVRGVRAGETDLSLSVTALGDEDGADYVVSDTRDATLAVAAAGEPPVADFEMNPARASTGETVIFDATGSRDPDGTIASYAWDVDDDGETDATGDRLVRAFEEAGTYPVTLTVEDDAGLTDARTRTLVVDAPTPAPVLDRRTLAFPEVVVGEEVERRVTLRNEGQAPLEVSAVRADGEAFRTRGGGFTLAAGGERRLPVTFAPGEAGAHEGTLVVETTADAGTLEVALDGAAVAPADVAVRPGERDFGAVPVGATATANVTVSNLGGAPLEVTAITTRGEGFAVEVDPFTLRAGGQRRVAVRFAPTAGGPVEGTLVVETDDLDEGTVEVGLAGAGALPDASVRQASRSFGVVAVGARATRTVTVQNGGDAPLTVDGVEVTGPGADAYRVDVRAPFTVPAGATREVSVSFRPTEPGPQNATLVLRTDDPDAAALEVALANARPVLVAERRGDAFVLRGRNLQGNATTSTTLPPGDGAVQPRRVSLAVATGGDAVVQVNATRVAPGGDGLGRPGRDPLGYLVVEQTGGDARLTNATVVVSVPSEPLPHAGTVRSYRREAGAWVDHPHGVPSDAGERFRYRVEAPLPATFAFAGPRAAIAVTAASLDRTAATVDEPVAVTATVRNRGTLEGTRTVRLRVGEVVIDEEEVALAPGQNRTVTFEPAFRQAGTYEVSVGNVTAGTLVVETGGAEEPPGGDQPGGDGTDPGSQTSTAVGPIPGFTAPVALLAAAVAGLFALRRRA